MTLLEELNTTLTPLGIPLETGVFSGIAPDCYLVIVPMSDVFDLHADNRPGVDIQEARLSLFSKGSYTAAKKSVVNALLDADFTITARNYIGYEADTGYHHYNVDVAKFYELEE